MPPENTTAPLADPDLDALRDEKCLPIAQGVLEDMAELLLTEDPEQIIDSRPMVMKMLERSLKADLNIQTETPYIPQLVLGALSGLNATIQGVETISLDEVRYASIGKKILSMVAEAHVRMTKIKPEDLETDFASVREKLNVLFAEEKLTRLEVKYIMDGIFDSFKNAVTVFHNSLDGAVSRAEAKIFGVKDMSEVTLKQLDGFLTADIEGLK